MSSQLLSTSNLGRAFWKIGTAAMRTLPPEFAHQVGIFCLQHGLAPKLDLSALVNRDGICLETTIPNLGKIPHPIGLAAGFDKDCDCPGGLQQVGFAFLELGTVTPKPQAGNARPRLFRERDILGLVNRMGFNNAGVDVVVNNLDREMARDAGKLHKIPIGINIGKNRITSAEHAVSDYLCAATRCADKVSFLVANISSPNTPGLRDLATPAFLKELSSAFTLSYIKKTWIKLDPDLGRQQFQAVVESAASLGFAGLVLTNTHRVEHPQRGGQSGHPLSIQSTARLEWAYEVHRGSLPMIGVGGIMSGADIFQKMLRGAHAVEIYTAFIYRGPLAVLMLLEEFREELRLHGFNKATDCIGQLYR